MRNGERESDQFMRFLQQVRRGFNPLMVGIDYVVISKTEWLRIQGLLGQAGEHETIAIDEDVDLPNDLSRVSFQTFVRPDITAEMLQNENRNPSVQTAIDMARQQANEAMRRRDATLPLSVFEDIVREMEQCRLNPSEIPVAPLHSFYDDILPWRSEWISIDEVRRRYPDAKLPNQPQKEEKKCVKEPDRFM